MKTLHQLRVLASIAFLSFLSTGTCQTNVLPVLADKCTLTRPYLSSLLAKKALTDEELKTLTCYNDARLIRFCVRRVARETDPKRQRLLFDAYSKQFLGGLDGPSEAVTNLATLMTTHFRQLQGRSHTSVLFAEYVKMAQAASPYPSPFVGWLCGEYDISYIPLVLQIYESTSHIEEKKICQDLLLRWGGFDTDGIPIERIHLEIERNNGLQAAKIKARYIAYVNKHALPPKLKISDLNCRSQAIYVLANANTPTSHVLLTEATREMLLRLANE